MPQRPRAVALAVLCALAAGGLALVNSADAHAAATHRRAVRPSGCARMAVPGHVTCFAEIRDALAASHPPAGASNRAPSAPAVRLRSKTGDYTPGDLADLYRIPSHASSTATIGIVEVGHDPRTLAQLAHYRQTFHLPACTTSNGCFREIAQDGSADLPPIDRAWTSEIAIDVQAVSAICPSCHILLVDAKDDAMRNTMLAAAAAADHGARYVSMSFGGPEDATTSRLARTYLSRSDVTYVAATGDEGYAGTALSPASAPNVVAVGGTSARLVRGGWRQSAWSGTGAGCARLQPQPTAQTLVAPAVSACGGRRAVSDVSALADVDTGMRSYLDGTWYDVGGTSLAAPIIAALYAIAGNHTDPMSIYRRAEDTAGSFVDITAGATGRCAPRIVCSAAPGWDGPTGLGTPATPAALGTVGTPQLTYDAATTGRLTALRPRWIHRSGHPSGHPSGRRVRVLRYRLRETITGLPVPDATVSLQRRTGHRWRLVTRRRTGAGGAARITTRLRRGATYRVVYAGDATHQPSRTPPVHLAPAPPHPLRGSVTHVRRSSAATARVSSLSPAGASKLRYLIYELT
jgi:hypothetical protein